VHHFTSGAAFVRECSRSNDILFDYVDAFTRVSAYSRITARADDRAALAWHDRTIHLCA
jgi:hypothetical protein